MAVSKGSIQNGGALKPLPVTNIHDQYARQRIHDAWQPNGFERYAYNKFLLDEMPVLGGPGDAFGGNPDRYEPVSPTMEVEFPISVKKR